ncbi:MAG TPA: TIGR03943 family protein [Tepidiformaceae bacterium]|nr:TIGR03943 family protein [Tepidiformaceae bacterium]
MVKQVGFGGGAAALGGLLALRLADGTAGYLVQSWYIPVIVVSALILLALAGLTWFPALRRREPFELRPTAAGLLTGGLVAFPLVLGLAFEPRQLNSGNLNTDAVSARQFTASAAVADPARRNIYQWAYEFETANPASIVGDSVEVVGFVFHREGAPADRFLVARFVVACCIADAQGFALPVQWKDAGDLKSDQWVRVIGRVTTAPEGELIIHATDIEMLEAPSNPYIYP